MLSYNDLTNMRSISFDLLWYIPAFIYVWTPTIIYSIIDFSGSTPPLWLDEIRALAEPLQGFVNFVIWGVLKYLPTPKCCRNRCRGSAISRAWNQCLNKCCKLPLPDTLSSSPPPPRSNDASALLLSGQPQPQYFDDDSSLEDWHSSGDDDIQLSAVKFPPTQHESSRVSVFAQDQQDQGGFMYFGKQISDQ